MRVMGKRIRLRPLRQWVCDQCNRVIRKPEEGYIEWLLGEDGCRRGFRIVHIPSSSPLRPSGRCDIHAAGRAGRSSAVTVGEIYLTEFSEHALPYLLSMIDPGPLGERGEAFPCVSDLREWAELTRRLTVPYYEEARFYLARADRDGLFGTYLRREISYPEVLRRVILEYGD
jgi:hypothetical protein